ncbi:MAG TPA: hypothetical protein VKB08_04350 [Bradyrhizobium sp.]|nr:hypothetical protein [Bradyrhizobium sp.]
MPLARYFALVGAALLALLFISDAYLPKLPDARVEKVVNKSTIRIHSDRKWPERIVFDTNQPTFVPAQVANTIEASVPPQPSVAEVSGKSRTQDAFAELQPGAQTHAQLSAPKKLEKQVVRKRVLASRRTAPRVMLMAQPQFGFFGQGTW